MQKKGKERNRSWYSNAPWIVLIILAALSVYWLSNRGPTYVDLKYGEFIQLLHAARKDQSISLHKVRIRTCDRDRSPLPLLADVWAHGQYRRH